MIIKLADFGFAKIDRGDLVTPQFTPYYVSPQVLIEFKLLTPNIQEQILLSCPHTFFIKVHVLERSYQDKYKETSPWVIIILNSHDLKG